ncbi:MAG: serine hydrolase domain-containing protein [Hyphomicrobiales bacterium]
MPHSRIMCGSPVPKSHRVPRNSWDAPPWNRWSFQHMREILPTVEVWRGSGTVWEFPRAHEDLDVLAFERADGVETTLGQWLEDDFADGFIVLHHGSIIYERYFNGMTERSLHLSQSVAKSITASLVGVLAERGLLDHDAPVVSYLPELETTAWREAKLQHVLDMTSGVCFDEEYTSLTSDIAKVDICSGWKPRPENSDLPETMWDLIQTFVSKEAEHGERFKYRSIETDVLAHVLERASGMKLAELLSKEVWSKIGAEESASFTIDSGGYALADGGFNATLRDYARFGQMIYDGGVANGVSVVPSEWIAGTLNRNHDKFGAPYTDSLPMGGYSNQFWLESPSRRTMMARGVFGQLIYIAPDDNMVVVKLSSWPEFLATERSLNAYSALGAISSALNG